MSETVKETSLHSTSEMFNNRTKREDWAEDKVELENGTVREVEKEAIRQEKPWNI